MAKDFISESASVLGVYASTLAHFKTEDPFNEGNTLEGVICNRSGHTYGALVIWRVNGEDVLPQRIYCTPKLYYPFTDDSRVEIKYKFPKHKEIRIYEKLDGTNICQYFYKDAAARYYITYKTRLTPVIRNTKARKHEDMWKEILEKSPEIEEVTRELYGKFSFSYELYGNRNRHMVRYNTALDVIPLFSVNQADASIAPPDEKWSFSKDAEPVLSCGKVQDIIRLYEKMRYRARSESKREGDYIVGSEGYVFYVLTQDDKWIMYKCKSDLVESRDWIDGHIPQSVIMPTVWNALETEDELNREKITSLLLEEFDENLVKKSVSKIDFCVKYVRDKIAFREKVLKFYQENNLDINKDKRETMKCFSQHFTKDEMKKIYMTLAELELVNQ